MEEPDRLTLKRIRRVQKDVPKAEMHVHISLALLKELYEQRVAEGRAPLGTDFITKRDRRYYADLKAFHHGTYEKSRGLTVTPEELALVTQQYLEKIADEGVIYAEVSNSYRAGKGFKEQIEAVEEGILRAKANTGIEARIVVTVLRDHGYEFAEQAAKELVVPPSSLVTGFGLVGDESVNAFHGYERALNIAYHEAGLGLAPHVAEQDVENAVDFLKVIPEEAFDPHATDNRRVRAGHGTLIHMSNELLREFHDKAICLEVCLSANKRIGVREQTKAHQVGDIVRTVANPEGVVLDRALRNYFNAIASHPITTFLGHRIPVVLGSDNPLLLNTNASKEYSLARWAGYGGHPIDFTRTAIQYANVDHITRAALMQKVDDYENEQSEPMVLA